MGSHGKSRQRGAKPAGEIFTQVSGNQSWTRKYPAITLAALAGTVVGGPGGVAAAMAFPGPSTQAHSTSVALPVAAPTVAPPTPTVTATVSISPSPTPTPTVTKPVNPYAGTTLSQLEPTGLYGAQEFFPLNSVQWQNARVIVQTAEQRKMPLYAAVIAIATASQESRLLNLTTASNADSLGLFQQRPSQGWGTAAQITNPYYSSNAFLAALTVYAPHYTTMQLWEAAQAVQRSGFPTAYAQWEAQAAKMVLEIVRGTAP